MAEMNKAMALQPCISTTIFGRVVLADTLRPIADAGFRYIELSRNSAQRAESRKLVEELGLDVWAVHGTLDVIRCLGLPEKVKEAVEREIQAMEDVAAYAPCPYVIHYMCRNTLPEGPAEWRGIVETLHEAAVRLGFILAVEPVPCRFTPAGFPFLCTTREAAEFTRSFNSKNLGLCIDMNHTNLAENLVEAARVSAGCVSTIHVSDNHGSGEEHLPPGEGTMDFRAGLRALYEAGYAGPINLEIHVKGTPTHELLVRLRTWAERMARDLSL